MKKHKKILENLITIARDVEPVSSAKIAAAIVYKNQIVSIGVNQRKTDPFQAKYGKNGDAIFRHAETAAIKAALRYLSPDELARSTLYVARYRRIQHAYKQYRDEWGMARPCQNGCMRAIDFFNISKIIYTLDGIGNFAVE